MIRAVTCLVFAMLGISCADKKKDLPADTFEPSALRTDLATLTGHRIFFGHQSVGSNILQGMKEIALKEGVESPKIINADAVGAFDTTGGCFIETGIGKNGEPDTKCQAFEGRLRSLAAANVEIAAMKFCYVDFDGGTDVASLVQHYCEMAERIHRENPRLVLVHFTVPLTVRTPWWKKLIKTVLGKEESTDIALSKRAEYNTLLRRAFAGDLIFDLAREESMQPNGIEAMFERDGQKIPYLAGEYTSDGGHLNQQGRERAARGLIRVLAAATKSVPH
jgi:hypothetical protein